MKTLIKFVVFSLVFSLVMLTVAVIGLQVMGVPIVEVVQYQMEQEQIESDTVVVKSRYAEKWKALDEKIARDQERSIKQALEDKKNMDLPPMDESVYEDEGEYIDLPIDSAEICQH